MRILTFAAVTLAFIASVSAKFNLGSCNRDIEPLAFADYGIEDGYHHFVYQIDRDIRDFLNGMEDFGFKPLYDWRCEDLTAISPFKEIAER
jgi:hypothetical protein